MSMFQKIITIKREKPAIRRLTIEAMCDSDISYYELEKVVKELKKKFDDNEVNCKIASIDNNVCVVMTAGENLVRKTLFEEYVGI